MSKEENGRLYFTPREAFIFSMRFTMYPPMSLDFVAAKLGVTRERVRQLESKLISDIRTRAGKSYPTTLEELGGSKSFVGRAGE